MLNVLRENKQSFLVKVILLITSVGLVAYLGSYLACEGGAGA